MEKVSTITVDEEQVDIWEATFTPDEIGVYGYKFIAGDGDTVKYYCEDGSEGKTGTVGDKNGLFFQLTVYDKDYKTPDWMKDGSCLSNFSLIDFLRVRNQMIQLKKMQEERNQ